MRPLLLVVAVAGATALSAASAQAQDRYGPERMSDQTVATLDGRYLNWPGKQTPADAEPTPQLPEPAARPAPVVEPSVAPEPPAPDVVALPPVAPAPLAVQTERPAPAPVVVDARTFAPQQQVATAQTAEAAGPAHLPPHIYSVARQYGLRPDPIPLPPQFFADQGGADLAAPPAALPPRLVPGAQTVNNPNSANTPANRARAIDQAIPNPDDVSPNDVSVN